MAFELKKLLKTLLISTSDPISAADVQGLITRYHQENAPEQSELDEAAENQTPPSPDDTNTDEAPVQMDVPSLVTKTQIEEAMTAIRDELQAADDVYILKQGPQGYYMATTPEYAEWVRLLRKAPKPLKLRQAVLETLAIIAYRQPVTRAEIEAIRGVSVDSAVAKLIELEFICVSGRAELPGRPMQYSTTEKFLEFCGIVSLDDLPASDIIESGKLTQWIKEHTEGIEMSDTDMGLHDDSKPTPEEEDTTVVITKETVINYETPQEEEIAEEVSLDS